MGTTRGRFLVHCPDGRLLTAVVRSRGEKEQGVSQPFEYDAKPSLASTRLLPSRFECLEP
jgi:hypothetical protein